MKTQIIALESHDNLISVRDKLSWAKTPRILLVWPKMEKVTLRILDLKVLQRHADSLGAQIGLVTRSINVRRDAESLGIPVFDSTASAQRDPWPVFSPRTRRMIKAPRRDLRQVRDSIREIEPAWRTSLFGRVVAFSTGVMAVLVLSGLFVPHAKLVLYPEAQTLRMVIPITSSELIESVSITGEVPARVVSVVVSTDQSLAIESEISVPKSKSKGVIRFTNLGQSTVNIAAGTVVATESYIRFITLHETLLPAGVEEFVDIPIESLEAGTRANLAAETITIVEGPLGLSVTVSNPNFTAGGTDTKVVGATDEDRSKLSGIVFESLSQTALDQVRAQISSSDILLMDTLEVAEILQEDFDPPAGQAGKTLLLKMKVRFSAHYVSADDLNKLSWSTLSASIPEGFSPFESAILNPLTKPVTDSSGVTHFDLEVSQDFLRDVDQTQVFQMIRSHSLDRAREELIAGLSLRQNPEVTISPSWWPWLPLIPINVSLELK